MVAGYPDVGRFYASKMCRAASSITSDRSVFAWGGRGPRKRRGSCSIGKMCRQPLRSSDEAMCNSCFRSSLKACPACGCIWMSIARRSSMPSLTNGRPRGPKFSNRRRSGLGARTRCACATWMGTCSGCRPHPEQRANWCRANRASSPVSHNRSTISENGPRPLALCRPRRRGKMAFGEGWIGTLENHVG